MANTKIADIQADFTPFAELLGLGVADKRIRPIAGFALKDGSWIKGGVELTYTYRSAR